jgi:hypothetical protein
VDSVTKTYELCVVKSEPSTNITCTSKQATESGDMGFATLDTEDSGDDDSIFTMSEYKHERATRQAASHRLSMSVAAMRRAKNREFRFSKRVSEPITTPVSNQ